MNGLGTLAIKEQLEDKLITPILYYVPQDVGPCVAVGCGYNDFLHAGLNPACTVCDGTGRTVIWRQGRVRGRIQWVDDAKLHVHQGLVSGEIGDVQIQGRLRDQTIYLLIQETDRSYLLIDGYKVKPRSITINKVMTRTTLDVRCNILGEGLA